MAEGLIFSVPAVEISDTDLSSSAVHEQSSQMLADALKRMDGLIGDFRPTSDIIEVSLVHDPVVMAIVEQATKLSEMMKSWDETRQEEVKGHPKDCIPSTIREIIVTWLSSKSQGSPQELERLREDKNELLKQVVSQQQQLEAVNNDREKLTTKVADLERRVIEKEEHIRSCSEELRLTKSTLHTKEVEVRQLHSEIKVGLQASQSSNNHSKYKRVTIQTLPPGDKQVNVTRKSSFKSLAKIFGKKKSQSASLQQPKEDTSPVRAVNPRAAAFYSMNCERICEWLTSVGLDMYTDIASQNLLTGDVLAGMVSRPGNAEFVRMGIVSTFHCKKLRLAVEDAISESPSPVSSLDHTWVGEWLCDIGLPQYQRPFRDARFDGRMLNMITVEDLNLLEVTTPFHVISIKRAIQALRLCGYDGNYLKNAKSRGSKKLLHWSVHDLIQWVNSIELDDYVSELSGTGIHGALMLLDVRFTSDSLARALGINSSKSLIRTHLSRKFMELLGPVAAQKKVDAMQVKGFTPLDPTEQPKGGRPRSRSLGSRRGREQPPEVPLCPFDQFPESLEQAISKPNSVIVHKPLGHTFSGPSVVVHSPTSTHSSASDHSFQQRPPTP